MAKHTPKRIAFTFAGRRDMMRNQVIWMRELLEAGVLDTWHVWDFTRNEDDRRWLEEEFCNDHFVTHTKPDSNNYVPFSFRGMDGAAIQVSSRSDVHLLFELENGKKFEVAIGIALNSVSLLREFDGEYFEHAEPIKTSSVVLQEKEKNSLTFDFEKKSFSVFCEGVAVFSNIPLKGSRVEKISVKTGYGHKGVWEYNTNTSSKIKVISTNIDSDSSLVNFNSCYRYYTDRVYAHSTFLKIDDDLIDLDAKQLNAMLNYAESSDGMEIVSANVINNDQCLYNQIKYGFFENSSLNLKADLMTMGPFFNTPDLCEKAHIYYLQNREDFWNKARSIDEVTSVPKYDRLSINCIAFKYDILVLMNSFPELADKRGDEEIMTMMLPAFGVKKTIFNKCMASHLSFFTQVPGWDQKEIIEAYHKLY